MDPSTFDQIVPVVSVMRAQDLDAAIDMIESNSYGNAASIFTQNGKWARDFCCRVETGTVWDHRGMLNG